MAARVLFLLWPFAFLRAILGLFGLTWLEKRLELEGGRGYNCFKYGKEYFGSR